MKRYLIILFAFISLNLLATDYYVKTGGNDGAAGTSDGTAWGTITKVNATSFSAGDRILFKRGNTWNAFDDAALACDNAGSSGSRITYGAYGTGAKPIITARHTIIGNSNSADWNIEGTWTNTSGNIWRMAYSYVGPRRLYINGTEAKVAQTAAVNATDMWYWTANYLYVHSVGNPATTYTNMEECGVSFVENPISVTANYVTLEYLDFRGGWIEVNIFADYNIIDSCKIGRDVGNIGLWIQGADHGEVKNCVFDTDHTLFCEWWDDTQTGDGLHIRDVADTWDIHHCYFKNWGHAGYQPYTETNGANVISNITFRDNYITAPDISYSKGFDVAGYAGQMSNILLYRNHFYDIPNENQIAGPNVKFYNNIVDKITDLSYALGTGDPGWGHGVCIMGSSLMASGVTGIEVYNNTIVNCAQGGIAFQGWGETMKENNIIRNNLLYNNNTLGHGDNTANHYQIYISWDDTYIGANTFQNNMLYSPSNDQVVYYGHSPLSAYNEHYTVAEFNAFNGTEGDVISGNIWGDIAADLFVDYANRDYHIKTTSVAYHAGVDVDLVTDYDGNARTEATPSIGAFEGEGEAQPEPETPATTTHYYKMNGKYIKSNGKFLK